MSLKIGLFGKGRLGGAIAEVAGPRLAWQVAREEPPRTPVDVAIEASSGEAVPRRLAWALETKTPLLIGSTGWELPDLAERVGQRIGVVLAPNFSLTMALYARFSLVLARFAALDEARDPYLVEHHHARKKDAPSGTAVQLARTLLRGCPRKKEWVIPAAGAPVRPDQLCVSSIRAGHTYSSHVVGVDAPGEVLELHHAARSARPYAEGALKAAEFVFGKRGLYTMDDVARSVLAPLFERLDP
jgi:4-hydroxy-tetrahydrodipicolinate reductase